jgi:DNA-binding CsgD family transcriptional regulator
MSETITLNRGLEALPPVAVADSQLSMLQTAVLSLRSEGHTVSQAARRLDIDKPAVLHTEAEIIRTFDAENLASAVNKAICSGELVFEPVSEAGSVEIDRSDQTMLALYANGVKDGQILEGLDQDANQYKKYKEDLFKRIGAWSGPHAVRRAYELGVLEVNNGQ